MDETERFAVNAAKRTLATSGVTCVVTDEDGVIHLAVPVDQESEYSRRKNPCSMMPPYAVAQCELFDAFDACDDIILGFVMPDRRWVVESMEESMSTCMRCLGG